MTIRDGWLERDDLAMWWSGETAFARHWHRFLMSNTHAIHLTVCIQVTRGLDNSACRYRSGYIDMEHSTYIRDIVEI